MKDIKKLMITLVALLLTAVTGAWAQSPTIYFQQDYATETVDWSTATSGRYTPIIENGYLTVDQNKRNNNGATLTCTATQGKVDAGKDFTMTFNVKLGASNLDNATEFNIYDAANSGYILSLAEGSAGATAWIINGGTQTATVSAGGGKSLNELSWIFVQVTFIAGENAKTYLTLKDEQNNIIDGFDKTEIPTISVAGGLGKMTFVTSRRLANFAIDNVLVCDVVNDAASSGPEVAWTAATKTGTFTMPGGNVTLEPEYYPQATVADGGVTAADADARATTDDPLVKVDATKLTGAKKLMYFVSNSGTAPAYDAEGWTDQLPTAEGFTQQGIVYVWYYPVGTDEGVDGATATYSDGDICLQSITARIAPEPTYAVEFAEGTDPNEWTADPAAGVTKGQTVTVTYTGAKKVIGVKAEKKAKAPVEVLTYSFDDASHPSGLTAGSRVSFDYSRTSVITNSKFLNAYNNTNGDPDATTVSLGDTDLSGKTWTLSFEWAACGGCNSKPDHTTLKAGNATLFDLSGNSNWNTTVTIIYTGSDGSKTLPVPGCDKSNRFTEAVGDQYNTTTYWHHIVVTGSAEGVKMTITNSSTGAAVVEDVVLSETNVNPTSLIIEPCCGGGIGIDALSLTYEE